MLRIDGTGHLGNGIRIGLGCGIGFGIEQELRCGIGRSYGR